MRIDGKGQVASQYTDSSGPHGYIRDVNGTIATFEIPGAVGLYLVGFNGAGEATGRSWDENNVSTAYFRSADGAISPIDPLGAPGNPEAVNAFGVVVGSVSDVTYSGFIRDEQGAITTFEAPGAMWTFPLDNNDLGSIAGSFTDSNGVQHGFIRQ